MAQGQYCAILTMEWKLNEKHAEIERMEDFIGESIEDKVRRVTTTGEPIEDSAPIIFQERKEGVNKAYDIRADKWDMAQEALDKIAINIREKRKERQMDKPAGNSEVNVPAQKPVNQ